MSKKFKEGLEVIGSKNPFKHRIGVIIGHEGEGRRRKWSIRWDNGEVNLVHSRSLNKIDRAQGLRAVQERNRQVPQRYADGQDDDDSEDDQSEESSSDDSVQGEDNPIEPRSFIL